MSRDDANAKIAVRLVQQEIEAKLPRWTMLRLGNALAERCSLILLACWFCPLISLTCLFLKPLIVYSFLYKTVETRDKSLVLGQFADSYELSIERIQHVVSGEIAETTR